MRLFHSQFIYKKTLHLLVTISQLPALPTVRRKMSRHLLLLAVFAGVANCLPQFQNQNNERKKREAQTQTCIGSQCNQNNQGLFSAFGSGLFAPAIGLGGFGGGATQNCQGSNCNQNNGGFVAPAVGLGGFGGGATQNCQGSNCNQNNGKK